MKYNKIALFLLNLLVCCACLSAENIATVGQVKFFDLSKKVAEHVKENKTCSQAYLDENVKPLLLESINHGEIWGDAYNSVETPPFHMFLSSEIWDCKNPFFNYALSAFLNSDRFQKGDFELRQSTFFSIDSNVKS
ncbi:MAG: hypothetical protein LBM70_03645 [Victivallales bacterium]|jgi:hypothetical protein|nr:hypothetical protein [Victivallales bacterium]